MKKPIHRIALYTATILISALPYTIDVAEANDKTEKKRVSVVNNSAEATLVNREKSRQKNDDRT
jgi:hypothetical protein